jgi:hypothetical protein
MNKILKRREVEYKRIKNIKQRQKFFIELGRVNKRTINVSFKELDRAACHTNKACKVMKSISEGIGEVIDSADKFNDRFSRTIKEYVKFDNEYFNFLSAGHSCTYRSYLSAAHFTSEDVVKQLHEKLEQLRYIRKEMKKHYNEGNVEEFQNALKRKSALTFGINAISGAYGTDK